MIFFEKLDVGSFQVGEGAPAAKEGGGPFVGVVVGQKIRSYSSGTCP